MVKISPSTSVLTSTQNNSAATGRRRFFTQSSGLAAAALTPAIVTTQATAAAEFEPLSASAFNTALNTTFEAHALNSVNAATATPIILILESVEAQRRAHPSVSAARAKEVAFSLKFSASTPNLPQNTYALSHPSLGTMPMLLVPSPNGKFMFAEFNRL